MDKANGENKKRPASQVHFLLQKNTGNDERQIMTSKEVMILALFSCHQPTAEDDDPNRLQQLTITKKILQDYFPTFYTRSQMKDKVGLDKRLNYNHGSGKGSRVPQCTPEKEEAIMDAFKHFSLV